MSSSRHIAFLILFVSAFVFLATGIWIQRSTPLGLLDFKVLYYGADCFTHHCDPYNVMQFQKFYDTVGVGHASDPPAIRFVVTEYVYFPTAFLFTGTFSLLPWHIAHLLWTILTCACFFLACYLTWSVCAVRAAVPAAFLIGLLLASSQTIFAGGNAVGLVVSLAAIATWCFIRNRLPWVGIIGLTIALLLKPHDAGPIWLFFVLAGGVFRKRALQTLGLTAVLAAIAFTWAANVAPHWRAEQQANLDTISAHGGMNSPSPGASVDRSAGMLVDLQAVLAIIDDTPAFYNYATYAVCGTLLLVWAHRVLRTNWTEDEAWFALAAAVPLSMLAVYHKPYDTKLLLLAVPACIHLWSEKNLRGQAALLLTLGALFCSADIPLAVYAALTDPIQPDLHTFTGKLLAIVVLRPVSLILIALTAFYLTLFCAVPLSSTARSLRSAGE
jgi:hypothetical protein